MLMASNENAGFSDCIPPPADEIGGDFTGDDDLTMDFDAIMYILNEDQGSDQVVSQNIPEDMQHSSPEELSVRVGTQVECPPDAVFNKNSDRESDFKETGGMPLLRAGVDATSSAVGGPGHWVDTVWNSDIVFDHAELDLSAQVTYQAEASASFKEWDSLGSGSDYCCTERAVHHPEYNMQGCSAVSDLAVEYSDQVTNCKEKLNPAWSYYGDEVHSDHMNYDIDLKCASQCPIMGHSNVKVRNRSDFITNCMAASEVLQNNSYKSVESSFPDANTPQNATSTESVCQSSDGVGDCYYNNMVRQCSDNALDFNQVWNQNHFTTCSKTLQSDEGVIMHMNGVGDFQNESGSCSSRISSEAREERAGKLFCDQLMHDGSDVKGQRLIYNSGHHTSSIRGNYFSDADSMSFDEAIPAGSMTYGRSHMQSRAQIASVKDEVHDSLLTPMNTIHHYAQTTETDVSNRSAYGINVSPLSNRSTKPFSAVPQKLGASPNDVNEGVIPAGKRNRCSSFPPRFQADPKLEIGCVIPAWKRARNSNETVDGFTRSSFDSGSMDIKTTEPFLFPHPHSIVSKPQLGNIKEGRSQLTQPNKFDELIVSPQSFYGDTSGCNVQVDDDCCIIDEVSRPMRAPQSIALVNSQVAPRLVTSYHLNVASQHSTISRPVGYSGVGSSRLRANDERSVFRVALQDLSQPKSEATPPEGLLAVPLLRHQRIALSWMIHKETKSPHCSGGILADDQGLGKTVSTIALILKERPSSSRVCQEDIQRGLSEALNLDEDDDTVLAKEKIETTNNLMQMKGRPAAGTLVVCPTSVLRQWAEELQNKVTSKAKLSVLVYHGGNRTKDPSELAKYDVVLTTYSIVSMEVPRQPLGDKDDHDKTIRDRLAETSTGASSSRSRHLSGYNKKNSKNNADNEGTLFESLARPLAKVRWFRVILDEAQSIKNHKTHVARACWGLRAKRRWCLSGTPIQNTVDDLYSYFRFLRYDPYSVYKSFCNAIKFPISKNPARGYKKLQAVLKTIMLRRTKGTFLDGKPVITLPPKFVELKKVEFSWKERDFYARLEADSRAQFAKYAAAGTVKQNYVNILLMLLRLRQACDHPLLVRKYDSGSAWKSSVDMVNKLPQERRQFLLNCLEGSLAICGICNDPPEDSVVSTCGHVFCNQCICEHLTLDDRKCPSTNCEERLSESFVFSKATLTNSLSLQSGQHNSFDCDAFDLAEGAQPFFEDGSYESSKIKAAVEVLQALIPHDCAPSSDSVMKSSDENLIRLENACDTQSNKFSNEAAKDQNSNCPVKVIGEKAIVFSQWTRMLDLLEARLKKSDIQYRRLDGTMSVTARDKAVRDFKTIPEVSVVIMSLKAASLGLNMVAASHVILLDLWWNPTTEDQAVDRAHRIGQTRPVKVLRLTVKDTVEDRILALQEKKREMVASAFGEDETGSHQSRLTVEDLNYLFMA